MEVSGLNIDDIIKLLDVFTQKLLHVNKLNIPKQVDVDQWPYLRGINIHEIDSDIDLFIGTKASMVMEPWDVIVREMDPKQ